MTDTFDLLHLFCLEVLCCGLNALNSKQVRFTLPIEMNYANPNCNLYFIAWVLLQK